MTCPRKAGQAQRKFNRVWLKRLCSQTLRRRQLPEVAVVATQTCKLAVNAPFSAPLFMASKSHTALSLRRRCVRQWFYVPPVPVFVLPGSFCERVPASGRRAKQRRPALALQTTPGALTMSCLTPLLPAAAAAALQTTVILSSPPPRPLLAAAYATFLSAGSTCSPLVLRQTVRLI